MFNTKKIDKNDLDYEIVSLSKQIDNCNKLLYYYEKCDAIIELRQLFDKKVARVMKLYAVL